MSLNDEFKAAKKRMAAAQEAEKTKAKTSRRSTRASSEWSKESEIVAYYLYKADSSKFLRENYAKKRKVSARAMSMKINMFNELDKGGNPKSESAHARAIIEEYGRLPVEDLLKVAISIHRGEFNGSSPKLENVDAEASESGDSNAENEGVVIKRSATPSEGEVTETNESES